MAIICICRGTRSGGQAVAECLAKSLRYPILGREVAQEAAERLGVSVQAVEDSMSDRPGVWSRLSSMRRAYVVAVQSALAERAVDGDLVYHGLSGGLLLKGLPSLFCMRLIAPMARRVRAVVDESGVDPITAERYILDLDQARARWVKAMYGVDIMDPSLYDLVINLESITVASACSVVTRTVEQPEYAVTEAVKEKLRDFRLACRMRVALAADPELRSLPLDAEAEAGVVIVTGEAPLRRGGETGDRIMELARSVPGVGAVRLRLEWFDPYP
jgi:cytidylate kinase